MGHHLHHRKPAHGLKESVDPQNTASSVSTRRGSAASGMATSRSTNTARFITTEPKTPRTDPKILRCQCFKSPTGPFARSRMRFAPTHLSWGTIRLLSSRSEPRTQPHCCAHLCSQPKAGNTSTTRKRVGPRWTGKRNQTHSLTRLRVVLVKYRPPARLKKCTE